jgi:hypothetical protein
VDGKKERERMKRISKERVKQVAGLIRESSLMTMVSTKGVLFFPIEAPEKISESETGVVLLETKKSGSSALVKPGLILTVGEKKNEVPLILFGYASTEYGVGFDISEYHAISDDHGFLSQEESAELSGLECLALNKEGVLVAFELGAEIVMSDN